MVATFEQLKKAYYDAEQELFISIIIAEQVSDAQAQASEHLVRAVKLFTIFLGLQSDKPTSCATVGTPKVQNSCQDFASVREVIYPELTRVVGREKADFCASVVKDIFDAKDAIQQDIQIASLIKIQKYLDAVFSSAYTEVKKQHGKTCCAYVKRHKKCCIGVAAVVFVLLSVVVFTKCVSDNPVQDGFEVVSTRQDYGSLTKDMSLEGDKLRIAEVPYKSGYATHANSEIEIKFAPKYEYISGACGMQDFEPPNSKASARCSILSGNRVLYTTGVMKQRDPAKEFRVQIRGLSKLSLVVDDADDGNSGDHVNWVDLQLK